VFTILLFLSFAVIPGAWEKHEQEKLSKGYLNGLVIDERINGLRSSLVVCFIHLYTELGPTECIEENITNKPSESFHYNPKITPCCFTSIVLQIVWRQHMFQDKLVLPGRTLCHSGMSSKQNWKKTRRVRYKSLSWFSCGSSILVELEFGVSFCKGRKTGEPWEKHAEQGQNRQQTQPTHGTGKESNPGHLALSPLRHPCLKRRFCGSSMHISLRASPQSTDDDEVLQTSTESETFCYPRTRRYKIQPIRNTTWLFLHVYKSYSGTFRVEFRTDKKWRTWIERNISLVSDCTPCLGLIDTCTYLTRRREITFCFLNFSGGDYTP